MTKKEQKGSVDGAGEETELWRQPVRFSGTPPQDTRAQVQSRLDSCERGGSRLCRKL